MLRVQQPTCCKGDLFQDAGQKLASLQAPSQRRRPCVTLQKPLRFEVGGSIGLLGPIASTTPETAGCSSY